MDTTPSSSSVPAPHPIPVPVLEQNGKRLPQTLDEPAKTRSRSSSSSRRHHHHHHQHQHQHHSRSRSRSHSRNHSRSHSRSHSHNQSHSNSNINNNSNNCSMDLDHASPPSSHQHKNNNNNLANNSHNLNNGNSGNTKDNANETGLSLREQQQQRNQQACQRGNNGGNDSSNSSLNGSPTSLTLSITPPKITSSYLAVDPSLSHYGSNSHNNVQDNTQGQSSSLSQKGSNNSLLGGSQDSLGSSLSQPSIGKGCGSRRASFNLSTGSLNFNPSSSTSLASPSSPSYSTIAVARARAAAAAAAGGGGGGGTQGVTAGGEEGGSGITESGVFPGAPPAYASSLSTTPWTSSASSSSSIPTAAAVAPHQDSFFPPQQSHAHPQTYFSQQRAHQHPPLSKSLTSSSSSLLSNASASSGTGSDAATGSGSSSGLPATHHLQDNATAEREISMILDDFLYLGGELVQAEQISELERLGIKRVLNMAENCDDDLWRQRVGEGNRTAYLKVGLLDHVDQDLKVGLDEAIKFIASSNDPVYVHCQAGKSRSVATVIGYLIQARQWPLKKAYDHVVERRRIMSPNIGFVSQLIMLEERVFGRENAGGLVSTVESGEEVDPASRTTVAPWRVS